MSFFFNERFKRRSCDTLFNSACNSIAIEHDINNNKKQGMTMPKDPKGTKPCPTTLRGKAARWSCWGKGTQALFVIGLLAGAGVITWGALTNWKFTFALITPTPTPTGFSVKVYDGVTLDLLDNGDFNYTLYGTDNLNDWVDFEKIEGDDSLSGLAAADLVDYDFFVIKFAGTVEIENPKNTDETMDVIYYERWVQVTTGANVLYSYRQPTTTGVVVLDSESFTAVNITAGIDDPTNVTIIVASNATETNAAWVKFYSYQDEADVTPYFLVEFDGAVAMSDFSIGGCSKIRYNSTALKFSFDKIDSSPQIFMGKWGEASGLTIEKFSVFFGDDELVVLA